MKNTQTKNSTTTEQLYGQLDESQKKIYRLTYYDSLTKLPNREKLDALFTKDQAENDATERALFLIDIDRFHSINELYGRAIGDKLLIQIADRLKNQFG